MKTKYLSTFLLLVMAAGCASDAPPEEAEMAQEAAAEPAMASDAEAIEAVRTYWAEHYNMGHADMVASTYAADAWVGAADGQMAEGTEAIAGWLQGSMEGGSQITLETGETIMMGDQAVSWGTYTIETTREGTAMAFSGSYMNAMNKVDGEWKISVSLANYDAAPPEGWAWAAMEGDAPAEEGTMGDLVGEYETHWNLGHPDMVADLFTENAMAAYGNTPPTHGRDAIAALLAERMGETPPALDIHDVATMEMEGGYMLDGGWYEMATPDGAVVQAGMYLTLGIQSEDGTQKIHWMLSNALPGS
jgi:uncharacterized protein (TIGR02246 family)